MKATQSEIKFNEIYDNTSKTVLAYITASSEEAKEFLNKISFNKEAL